MGKITATVILVMISLSVSAAPKVIYDSGKTESIARYTDIIKIYNPKKKPPLKVFNPLPISTPSLTQGTVVKRRINQPYLSNPIFLFGADKYSMNWLRKNKELLKRIEAIGILVNVKDEQELKAVSVIAKGLKIIPAPAVDLAKQLNLSHYPLLISKEFIEQ